jgi:hypothetical protein
MSKALTLVEKQKSDERARQFRANHEEAKRRYAAGERVDPRFHLDKYTPLNQLLIVIQCPNVQEVHGFWEWQDLGFAVKKGEPGIAIRAPHFDEDNEFEGCHRVYVWDVSQVAPMTAEQIAARDVRRQKKSA